MLAHALATALLFILSIYVFMPSLWRAIMAIDDYDHEYGLAVVAARNPVRESGPPANMAKLILLRHKIQTSNNRKRRNSSVARQAPRAYPTIPRSKPWIRLRRPFSIKQH
ncbi:hypothetical protein CYLTODRAFT_417501 [Cylindrobasidium torrendii FP15055 ss-10]|uniref:Uncharacterized protein n=1 Tax=Cylindrobasidium torrendii FP15055 ss-10 TaxID=1314674 RepID=A0A0D7BRW5_9AGAR|nr:hypothetical protein CYLTODRAFT_417501 [Cylindrobasidium torrendii FP15055 ss-10]